MNRIRPLTAAIFVASIVSVAAASAHPYLIVCAALILIGVSALVQGPRRHCFRIAAVVAAAILVLWLFWALLIDQPASSGTVAFTLPRRELGPGVTIGGTKTVAWLQQMLTSGAGAGLVVLGWGLLAQLHSARDWLSFASVTLGRAVDVFAPLICLFEAAIGVRRIQGAAATLGGRVGWRRFAAVLASSAEMAHDWRLDHPKASGGDIASLAALLGIAAIPVVMLVGVSPEIIIAVLLLACTAYHLRDAWRAWLPRAVDIPLLISAAALLVSWGLRDFTGDGDLLTLGGWPSWPPILSGSLGLVVLAIAVTELLPVKAVSHA